MPDETLDKLLQDSFLRKQKKEKSFADLYDLGYEKNDKSINRNDDIFDAEKVLGKTDHRDFDDFLKDFDDDEWDKLKSVRSTGATDEEIQSASNAELFGEMPIDVSAAQLVNQKYEEERNKRLKRRELTAVVSERPEAQQVQDSLYALDRPKGHPANSQHSGYVPYNAKQPEQRKNAVSSGNGKKAKSKPDDMRQKKQSTPRNYNSQNNSKQNSVENKKNRNKGSGEGQINGEKSKKKSKIKKVVIIILLILLIIFGLLSALIFRYAGMLNIVESPELGETAADVVDASGVKNILLIGSDTRNEEAGRSDTMILISINSKTDKIVQTSFMRDILVSIPGYGYAKLNAAYAYGGAKLVMKTIEQNFKIKVEKYMHIDFLSFVGIIDAVGGLELTVNDDEALAMNDPMNEVNDILGRAHDTGNLSSGGTYHMDGVQSLAYARIRYAGDGDFDRTERQREVVEKIIEKFKDLSIFKMNKALETILPEITTNMSKTEIYFLCLRLPFIMGYDMTQFRVPYGEQGTGFWNYGDYNGESILDIDFDKNNALLKSVVVDGENLNQ